MKLWAQHNQISAIIGQFYGQNRLLFESAKIGAECRLDGHTEVLGALWHVDARIVDARGTTEPDDDFGWNGRPAIMDRYLVAVLANPPPLLEEASVVLRLTTTEDQLDAPVDGTEVTGIAGTDQRRFVWQEGRWWMLELLYGYPQILHKDS